MSYILSCLRKIPINFETLATLVLLSLLTWFTVTLYAERLDVLDNTEWIKQHKIEYETEIKPLLNLISDSFLRKPGRAVVEEDGTQEYLLINVNGPASNIYLTYIERQDRFTVSVKNLSSDVKHETRLVVTGSYEEPEGKTMIRLSRPAARRLGVPSNVDEITVVLELKPTDF
jgi:hypothetical protein